MSKIIYSYELGSEFSEYSDSDSQNLFYTCFKSNITRASFLVKSDSYFLEYKGLSIFLGI